MNSRKWEVSYKQEVKNKKEIVRVLLENRKIKTEKEKKEFFNPTPPEKLSVKSLSISQNEINKAIKRIKKALKTKEKVIVYGDYDADGICGTAILWETLYSLGLNVLPYIPERFTEGYGLNAESIKNLKLQDPNLKLIITVDHGIVARKKVDVARELGIDVIITDHHEPHTALTSSRGLRPRVGGASMRGKPGYIYPKALAIVHTQKISGSAVAWILSREIAKKFNHQPWAISCQLELAAIGTIADQLPLVGPNRAFAKYGLLALQKTKRAGLKALFEKAVIVPEDIGPYEVGFLIAPRLNAMGRLEHAMQSLRLLCTKDGGRATKLANDLNRVNLERQKIVDEVVAHARKKVSQKTLDKIIVLAHSSYHEGVIGLAAGKLVEEFYRPAIVFSEKKEISKASARSISGFNIIEAIRQLEDLYIEGGGHPMAAGFSIKTALIGKFSKRLNEIAKPLLTDEILNKTLKIDLEVHFNQLNRELLDLIESFEPTGLGNPAPTFATKDVLVEDVRAVGRGGKHLKLKLGQNSCVFDAIAFGVGELFGSIARDSKIDIAYALEENTWNGNKKIQLKIRDIKV